MVLKYDVYKTLSPKLKEEYNWKFKEPPVLNYRSLLSTISIFMLLSIIILFSIYVSKVENTVEPSVLKEMATTATILMNFGTYAALFWCIEFFAVTIIYLYKFRKWKKLNNIK